MKLFDDFEAVRFPEEDLIFITSDGYIYYIYRPENKYWSKYKNAGNDRITVSNYQDVCREEITDAMGGSFPQKETDFMRLCNPSQLCIRDMLDLMDEDYTAYLADYDIYHTIHSFLLESDICHRSFLKLKELLDNATENKLSNEQVLIQVRKLSYEVIGRDIFKKEIMIVDGKQGSSFFDILPVRIIDDSNTNGLDTVAEMNGACISIEEDDVNQYLEPFLLKHFDDDLEANKKRIEGVWENEDGTEETVYVEGFEWYLTYNFYTFDSIMLMMQEIRDTIDALSSGRDNEYTSSIIDENRGLEAAELLYAKNLSQEQIDEYNANRPKKNDTEKELIIDFYRRFLYRMEYMLTVGKEKGYDLISFMGP